MAKYKPYRCPDCEQVFRHMHLLSDLSDLPDRCPLCDSWVSTEQPPEEVYVPQAPAVHGTGTQSAKTKAADDVYYGMEDASKLRAQMMADAGGGSASDYAHTQITNIRTGEGVVAAMPPQQSDVTRMMAQTQGVTGNAYQQNAMAYAEATRYGPGAYAGERTRNAVTQQHQQQLRAVVGAGTIGTHR